MSETSESTSVQWFNATPEGKDAEIARLGRIIKEQEKNAISVKKTSKEIIGYKNKAVKMLNELLDTREEEIAKLKKKIETLEVTPNFIQWIINRIFFSKTRTFVHLCDC